MAVKRDRRRKRPTRPVPLALVPLVRDREFGMPLLGGCGPEGGIEAVRVHDLFPGDRFVWIGQVEVPWRVAVQFADVDQSLRVRPRGSTLKNCAAGSHSFSCVNRLISAALARNCAAMSFLP